MWSDLALATSASDTGQVVEHRPARRVALAPMLSLAAAALAAALVAGTGCRERPEADADQRTWEVDAESIPPENRRGD